MYSYSNHTYLKVSETAQNGRTNTDTVPTCDELDDVTAQDTGLLTDGQQTQALIQLILLKLIVMF